MDIAGVDYATGNVSLPSVLKSAGKAFACRYIAPPGSAYDWKRLTAAESLALRRAGLKIVTVFESSAQRALGGRAAGVADAHTAVAELKKLGAPADAVVYFAVDFDATDAQKPTIAQYLSGAASVIGHNRVGVYGDYYVVKYMAENDVCDWFWQTYAWSGGLVWRVKAAARKLAGTLKHPSAHLYQNKNGVKLGGATVDLTVAFSSSYGQWFSNPPPPPSPALAFPKDDAFWTWVRWRQGVGEFAGYGIRNPDVRPNVSWTLDKSWYSGLSLFVSKKPAA